METEDRNLLCRTVSLDIVESRAIESRGVVGQRGGLSASNIDRHGAGRVRCRYRTLQQLAATGPRTAPQVNEPLRPTRFHDPAYGLDELGIPARDEVLQGRQRRIGEVERELLHSGRR